jgi:hypothetical protein
MGAGAAENGVLERVLGELASLREENQRLASRVEALHCELREAGTSHSMNRRGIVPPGGSSEAAADGSEGDARSLSRRGVFKLGGAAVGGAALAVGASALGAGPAAADGPNVLLGNGGNGTGNDAGGAQTSITSAPASGATLNVLNSVGGSGLYGRVGAASGLSLTGCVVGDTVAANIVGVVGANGDANGTGVLGIRGAPSGFFRAPARCRCW